MTKQLLGLILTILLLGAAACTPRTADPSPVRGTPSAEPERASREAEILADCFQPVTAFAWLDENGDGVQDADERPLAGIQFVLEPSVYSRATSAEDGLADILAVTPGETCPENQQIMAVKYEGYTLTTPPSLPYGSADTVYAFGFQPLPSALLVETEAYSGGIFTAVATAEFITWLDEPADDFWTPTAAEVANFEAGLEPFLLESSGGQWDTAPIIERLPEYTRQYFGLVQNDQMLLLVNFFCDAMGSDWLEMPVVVEDGGNCYLQIIFNPEANTYLSIYVNGES